MFRQVFGDIKNCQIVDNGMTIISPPSLNGGKSITYKILKGVYDLQ